MAARDVRAVENPITAIFDLAEDVERMAPKVDRLLRYTRIFVWVWLLIDALVILFAPAFHPVKLLLLLALWALLSLLRTTSAVIGKGFALAAAIVVAVLLALAVGEVVLGAALVSLFYLGMVILDLLRDARGFFAYFGRRYRVIRAVRDADPVVLVPQGATPVDRLLATLARRSPAVAYLLSRPQHVRVPAIVAGRSGVSYQFDALLVADPPPILAWGSARSRAAVFVKVLASVPRRSDLEALRRAVEDVAPALGVPPSRVIALWMSDGRTDIPEETYAFLTGEVARARVRGRTSACSMELVTEMPDGTYDFIPVIVEPGPPVPAPVPADAPS